MSEFIAYLHLTDSLEISPKYSKDNEKTKVCFQNIFPVASNYASPLTYFKLLRISRQPIKISEKPDTLLLIDAL